MNVRLVIREARKIYLRTAYPKTSPSDLEGIDLGPEVMTVVIRIAEMFMGEEE